METKQDTVEKVDTLVVGAGLAGLMAAHALQASGQRVVLLEKGQQVGGRLATCRIGPGYADAGAQFFTVRTQEFQNWVDQWQARGWVYRWSSGWSDGSLTPTPPDGYPRYAVRDGMQRLAQHLAAGLDVRLTIRVTAIIPAATGWRVHDEGQRVYGAQTVILTPPVPQTLAILEAGQVSLAPSDHAALARIEYAPCLAGLFWVEGPVHLPEPGAVQRPQALISWIADNRRKGISPVTTLTVHAGPVFSQEWWEKPADEVLARLIGELREFLDPSATIVEQHLKRWRYALPIVVHPERCLVAVGLPPLVFAGDAFGGPRVEGALLSGLAAARQAMLD